MSPEFFAILFALVIYTASHIAEIVRGSIQAVPKGQGEAADARWRCRGSSGSGTSCSPGVPHRRATAR